MAEKTLNEVPRPIRELYEKGRHAFERENYDYALALFTQILEKEPGCFEARQALRALQIRKAGAGGGFFKKLFGTAANSPKLARAQLALKNDPQEAMRIAEQILVGDPSNVSAHKLLASAAFDLELPRTAVLSLEIAFRNAPQDRDVAFRLGEGLLATGDPARAEMIFSELARASPNDPAVAQALKNFSAAKTLSEGGYENISAESTYRTLLKDSKETLSLEQANREVKSEDVSRRLISEYRAQLQKEPANSKLAQALADLHLQRHEFDEGLAILQGLLLNSEAKDPALEVKVAQTVVRKFDHAIAQLPPADPQSAAKREALLAERDAFVLQDCQRRCAHYPNDLQARFELGQAYFRLGKVSAAIQEFQRAQTHPNRRVSALNYLGQCFSLDGKEDMAARSFETAMKEKAVFDEEKKELTYRLGVSLEKLGKPEEAMTLFKEIYQHDIGYRDVAAKVDRSYRAQQA